jgi:two-component system LytT family response regulator
MIRALVVDDEPLAREGLVLRLKDEPDVTIVGEAGDGRSAIEALRALAPDLVFLDVQMPDLDGFGVLREAALERLPAIIFVTAHERHALRAFEVSALDYLLKPVAEERLAEALTKARAALKDQGGPDDRVARLLDYLDQDVDLGPGHGVPRFARRLVAKDRDRYLLLPVEDIAWIAAAGNYAEIHATGGRVALVRATLAELEQRLDPAEFARIHRSTLVRLARARELRPDAHGDFDLVLDDGTILAVGRAYRGRVLG